MINKFALQIELDRANECLRESGIKDLNKEQLAAISRVYSSREIETILQSYTRLSLKHSLFPFTVDNEHRKLHCGNNGYIEIDCYGYECQSSFVPEWVIKTMALFPLLPTSYLSMIQMVFCDLDFDGSFTIPSVNGEKPLHVASDGIISIGSASFEVGLPIVFSLYHKFNKE